MMQPMHINMSLATLLLLSAAVSSFSQTVTLADNRGMLRTRQSVGDVDGVFPSPDRGNSKDGVVDQPASPQGKSDRLHAGKGPVWFNKPLVTSRDTEATKATPRVARKLHQTCDEGQSFTVTSEYDELDGCYKDTGLEEEDESVYAPGTIDDDGDALVIAVPINGTEEGSTQTIWTIGVNSREEDEQLRYAIHFYSEDFEFHPADATWLTWDEDEDEDEEDLTEDQLSVVCGCDSTDAPSPSPTERTASPTPAPTLPTERTSAPTTHTSPTSAPTSAPTTHTSPTSAPTSAPTTHTSPTSAPTSAPTMHTNATSAPTSAPTMLTSTTSAPTSAMTSHSDATLSPTPLSRGLPLPSSSSATSPTMIADGTFAPTFAPTSAPTSSPVEESSGVAAGMEKPERTSLYSLVAAVMASLAAMVLAC